MTNADEIYIMVRGALTASCYSLGSSEDADHVMWTKECSPCNIHVIFHRRTGLVDMWAMFPCGEDGLWSEYRVFGLPAEKFLERMNEIERYVVQVSRQLYFVEQEE